jgi:predicted PurR-regulated permease PerM
MNILSFIWSNISAISTVLSIILSIAAILYTLYSGQKISKLFNETLGLLNKIETQNKRLVDKINHEISKNAYDEDNIKDIRESKF